MQAVIIDLAAATAAGWAAGHTDRGIEVFVVSKHSDSVTGGAGQDQFQC